MKMLAEKLKLGKILKRTPVADAERPVKMAREKENVWRIVYAD